MDFILDLLFIATGEVILFIVTFGKRRPLWRHHGDGLAVLKELSFWIGLVFWLGIVLLVRWFLLG